MSYFPGKSEKERLIDIKEGSVDGLAMVQKFGINADVDSAAEEDIWSAGGSYTGFLAAASTLELVSDDANDASVGTGARTVTIWGLDSNFDEQSETVTLNGTTAVSTANDYIRLFRMKVITVGSGGTAAGTITARVVSAGATLAEIPVGYNQTEMAVYTVPAGKTGYIMAIKASAADAGTKAFVTVGLRTREEDSAFCDKFNVVLATDGTAAIQRDFVCPISCPEKTDIIMYADSSQNDTFAAGAFDIILKDD